MCINCRYTPNINKYNSSTCVLYIHNNIISQHHRIMLSSYHTNIIIETFNIYTIQYYQVVTNIFTKNLDDISSIERPIHYIQDKKENHIFVKEDNVWGQDSEVDKLGQSIDSVARKQINQIKQWESKNPDWNTTEQGINEYMQIIQNVMGGSTECEREKNRNLIKKGLSENIDISTDVKNED